jgi:hypothetical protein
LNTPFLNAIKLASATAEDPVLVGKDGSYGYVYNLLLGISSAQTTEIKAIKTKDIEKRAVERKAILDKIIVKDLRSTWLLSGYDFDTATKCFTGDYTFAKDAKNSLPFFGNVTHLNADKVDEEDYQAKYRVDSVNDFTVNEFVEMMDKYVYGSVQSNQKSSSDSASIYKKAVVNTSVEEYDAKINELLFAFSTDAGSLNTYKGYLVSPKPDIGGAEKFVDEFAMAGRAYITDGLSGSSYIVVATDYGYHVMFFSEIVSANVNYATLDAYLDSLGVDKGTATWAQYLETIKADWADYEDEDFYLYNLLTLYADADNVLSNKRVELFNKYAYDQTKVVKYTERYSDLIGE